MSVEATLIVFFASQKLHQVRHFATLSQSGRRYLWATAPVTKLNSCWFDIAEIPWIYHCMFEWHCIVHIATYIFCIPYFSPFHQPVASSSKSHQVQMVMKPRERLGLRSLEDHWYIHVHRYYMYIQYTHIHSGFRRINQNNISNAIYKDMLLLQGHVAFETQIFITDEHIQTTYIKIHKWSCAHNCLFTYMQSTPASTESFGLRSHWES